MVDESVRDTGTQTVHDPQEIHATCSAPSLTLHGSSSTPPFAALILITYM